MRCERLSNLERSTLVDLGDEMEPIQKLLVIRLDGLGDALATVPLLEGLARAQPSARISVVCSSKNAGVFAPERVVRLRADGPGFADELRSVRYDAAIVATEEVAGYHLARASGAARRIGFWHGLDKPFKSLWQRAQLTDAVKRPAAWVRRPEHEVETLYRLGAPVGAAGPPPADARQLRGWLEVRRDAAAANVEAALGFQIAAKLTTGGWGPAAIAKFIESAWAASRLRRCALICAPPDERLARATLERLDAAVGDGRVSLAISMHTSHWFGTLDALAALVTPDTGAAHAAGILGVPVVDLFEADRFAELSRRWRPWATQAACAIKPAWRSGVEAAFGREVGAAISEIAR